MQHKYYLTPALATGLNRRSRKQWSVMRWMLRLIPPYWQSCWKRAVLLCSIATMPVCALAQPATALNPDVNASTINDTICVVGYTKTVRPSTLYTNAIKKRQMLALGIPWENAKAYQLDHIIALSLGGHPRSLNNLQTIALRGHDGAHRKDALSKRLQCLVCTGRVSLGQAQTDMYGDWQQAADKYKHQRCSRKRYEGD